MPRYAKQSGPWTQFYAVRDEEGNYHSLEEAEKLGLTVKFEYWHKASKSTLLDKLPNKAKKYA